jgi:hypothetical protein
MSVSGVAGVVASRVVVFLAVVVNNLTVEGALDRGFGELLEQPVWTEQAFASDEDVRDAAVLQLRDDLRPELVLSVKRQHRAGIAMNLA